MTRYARWFAVGVLAVAAAVVPLAGCKFPTPTPPDGNPDGVKVAVTFPALYSLAANVVGDTGTVRSVKSTQGAHGSEVTKAELDAVGSSDVLLANGLGLDDEFAKKLAASSSNPTLKVVKVGDKLKHKYLLHGTGCTCSEEDGHKHEEDEDAHDPHVWMGLDRAVAMVDVIVKELGEQYPQHKDTFYANAEKYKDKLKALKAEGMPREGTKAEDRLIVTAHGSMAYFADTFKITVVDTIQKSAGREPSKKQLDELVEKCKTKGVKVIASEPQFSKLGGVKTLADELKRLGITATVIELDNLESATAADLKPDWYETKMQANIAAMKDVFGQ